MLLDRTRCTPYKLIDWVIHGRWLIEVDCVVEIDELERFEIVSQSLTIEAMSECPATSLQVKLCQCDQCTRALQGL
eukprot:2178917-Prymnesium_polylepis.1